MILRILTGVTGLNAHVEIGKEQVRHVIECSGH